MAVGTCQSTVGILCAPAVMAAVIECVDLYNKTNKVITIGRRASKNDPALHHDFDFRGDRVHEYILDCRGADPERFSNIA